MAKFATKFAIVSASGVDLFLEWFRSVRDPVAKVQILQRVNRMEQGHFGDHRFCGEGVWELRVDAGAGYRVYYAQSGATVMLLLCGGDKRSQDADIKEAKKVWKQWQQRSAK